MMERAPVIRAASKALHAGAVASAVLAILIKRLKGVLMMNKQEILTSLLALLLLLILMPALAAAAESDEELAKEALNPVAAMISLPLQYTLNYGIGPGDDAECATLNIQPVVPISLTRDMNLVIRTIVPVIDAESPIPGGDDESGLGDVTQSFFFSPTKLLDGWIAGFGPVFLYPTASEDTLGTEQWGAGPTGVVLKQDSGFTYGTLFNHIWSFAGDDKRADVSATFLQPFFYYTTKTFTSLGVYTESTYDWQESQWTVPINVALVQIVKIAGQPLSIQAGYLYYAEKPDNGPDWGLRFALTFLFPKK